MSEIRDRPFPGFMEPSPLKCYETRGLMEEKHFVLFRAGTGGHFTCSPVY